MIRVVAFALTALVSALAMAAEPAVPAAANADAAAIATKVCAACHGTDGNGSRPANTSLAG